MKTIKYILLSSFLAVGFLSACNDDDIDSSKSIFNRSATPKNVFDAWLYKNYIKSYNIDYKYRMEDIEIDFSKNLAPAELEKSMKLAKIIKHVWLEAYVEAAGPDFMKKHAPAILQIIGSASWNEGGTITLGTAEGGLKITLYMTNWLNPKDIGKMNEYFFKTMHHEFTHILQQDINYPQEYNLISAEDYRPSGWQNRNLKQASQLGFITPYAGSMAVEDITEITCCYVTYTQEEWDTVLQMAGESGRKKLEQKTAIMKKYMQEVWKIDMDNLKKIVHRRMNEVIQMSLMEPEWEALLSPGISDPKAAAALQLLKQQLKADYPEALDKMNKHKDCCQIHNANLINLLEEPEK
ncbi:zinc-binding metallopeptidase [Bacteroides pyogenes]|uniref:zinc-binding metallopeptidase n=1 Tax=Bacteroides pyogenes TaxID=310300 RepID=UPI003FA17584